MSRGVSQETRDLVDRARELWETRYQPIEITPTVRHLYYALAVEERIPKSKAGYGKVQRTLARARERGDYPWDGICDPLRKLQTPSTWANVGEFVEAAGRSYRLDKWQAQPERLEVWIEKDTVRGTVASLMREFQLPLLVGRGYLSVSAKHEASQRIDERRVILYVGDFDPSGINMIEEAEGWVRDRGGDLTIERIAITEEDYSGRKLLDLPVNRKDRRAEEYLRRYGDRVIEVEALPPEQLQARLRNAIKAHIDESLWTASEVREEREQLELRRLVSAFDRELRGEP